MKLSFSLFGFYNLQCSEDVLKAVKVVEAFDIFQLMTVLQNIKEDFISQVYLKFPYFIL